MEKPLRGEKPPSCRRGLGQALQSRVFPVRSANRKQPFITKEGKGGEEEEEVEEVEMGGGDREQKKKERIDEERKEIEESEKEREREVVERLKE